MPRASSARRRSAHSIFCSCCWWRRWGRDECGWAGKSTSDGNDDEAEEVEEDEEEEEEEEEIAGAAMKSPIGATEETKANASGNAAL